MYLLYIVDPPYVLLLLVSPHDSNCHDKETKVDEDDDYDWSNECPDEVCGWVQVAAGNGSRVVSDERAVRPNSDTLTQHHSHSYVVMLAEQSLRVR